MPSYEPPKRATEYITYVALIDSASGKLFKVNPTLAAGDVKVSIDGAAEANLATLPVVTPAGSRRVKVVVSVAEMTGDNIGILFSDAAGAEWNDLFINLQTAARQIDDLAFPTVAGRSIDVETTGEVGLSFDNIKAASAPTTLTNITVPVVTGVTNDVGITQAGADKAWGTAARTLTAFGFSVAISGAAVQAIWDALVASLTTANSIGKRIVDFLTGDAFARLGAPAGASTAADIAAVKAETATIQAKTTNLPADPADESNTQGRFNTIDAALGLIDDFLDTEVAAIKAKTDNLPADPADASDVAALIDAVPTATENADTLLNRDLSAVTVTNSRSPINGIRLLRNKWSLTAIPGSLVVYEEDDTTIAWQAPVTTDPAAEPVTSVDPT